MKKIRYYLECLLVKFWLFLIRHLSLKQANSLAVKIFQTIGMKLKVTATARRNLTRVFPELKPNQINQIILDVWSNFAHMASETPILVNLPQDQFDKHVKIIGIENIDLVKNKKALFFTAHMANWEIVGKALVPYGVKFNVVYRSANNRLVDKIINDLRQTIDVGLIPKGRGGAKQIIGVLQAEGHVVMLVDQKMNDGIKVPFLGYDAMTASAIASLALKYDCPIIPLQVIRKPNSHFEIIIHPAMEYERRDVESIMKQINQQIGEWVKANPEQWFWLHKRWIE